MLWLFLQLLVLMLSLVMIGEPIRFLLLRNLKLFNDLDLLQAFLLDLYLGGFALYAIAMLPLRFFNQSIVLGLAVSGFLLSSIIHSKTLFRCGKSTFRTYLAQHKTEVVDYLLVLTMFLAFLWIQLVPLSNYVFGSVHDTSLHSLMVRVILENSNVPVTLQPYLSEGIIYPQASHVVFAYASHLLSLEAPKAVFYATPLFNSLSVLGAYFLGKKLWKNNRGFYLGLSYVFAFVSSWPLYITWGANPFIAGFPLFLVCLGLLFSVSQSKGKNGAKSLATVGVLFGYSGALIISFLETLLAMAVLWLAYEAFRRSGYQWGTFKELFLIFLVSLFPLSPFLGRFIEFYQYPGHNIGIASGFIGYEKLQPKLTQALEWALQNLNPNVFLGVELISLLLGFAVLLWRVRGVDPKMKSVLLLCASVFLASTFLSFVSYFLPADVSFISWPHQSIILSIPISIFVVVFHLKLVQILRSHDFGVLFRVFSKRSYGVFLVTIAGLTTINLPFIYSRFAMDPTTLVGTYGLFAVTTEDDYNLMHWMKVHLPSNATVLVSPFEAGLFIPSTSNHRAIFPYVASQRAHDYQLLTSMFSENRLNMTAFEIMQSYAITHIFVGSQSTYWWTGEHKWNGALFLGNPNFKLLKRFGNSYLFEVSLEGQRIALFDDFNYENLTEMGWALNSRGLGVGDVMVTSVDGSNCLLLRAASEMSGDLSSIYFYEIQISRKVYLDDVSNVTLSFFLNSTSGRSQPDAATVVVSNVWSNLSLHFTTPNGIFQFVDPNQTRTFVIDDFAGDSTFNISRLWSQVYGSDLPDVLVLQVRNTDFDGTPNVVILDSLKIAY